MVRTHNDSVTEGDDRPSRFPGPSGRSSGSAQGPAGQSGSEAIAPPTAPIGGWLGGGEAEFLATVELIRAHLTPTGPIETLLMDRLIQAAWRLRRVTQAEAAGVVDETLLRFEALAERSLYKSLRALEGRQARRRATGGLADRGSPQSDPDDGDSQATADRRGSASLAAPLTEDDPGNGSGRLSFDPNISEESPVVRGTWITVNHVVSLIVDGWTWTDILRSHPEMNEDDIRACLAYHVQEEHGEG